MRPERVGKSHNRLKIDDSDLTATELIYSDLKLYNRLHGIEDEDRETDKMIDELEQRGEDVSEEEFLQKLDPQGYTRQFLDVLPLLFPDKETVSAMSLHNVSLDDMEKQELAEKQEDEEFEENSELDELGLQDEKDQEEDTERKVESKEDDETKAGLEEEDEESPSNFRKRWENRLNLQGTKEKEEKKRKMSLKIYLEI